MSAPPDGDFSKAKRKRLLRTFSVKGAAAGKGFPGDAAAEAASTAPAQRQLDETLRAQNTRLQEKIKRQARTHALLVSIVVVFALSWFPLNVLNIVLDVKGDIFQVREPPDMTSASKGEGVMEKHRSNGGCVNL